MPKTSEDALDNPELLEQITNQVDGVLRNAFQREVSHGREPVFHRTPLHDLVEAEEEVPENEFAIRLEGQNATLDYIFADGPDPRCVVQRAFALARVRRSELLLNMSLEELGLLIGETRAAQSWRIKKIFSKVLKQAGMKGFKLSWQKSEESVAKYSEAAKGNTNRRGGKKNNQYNT